MSDPAEYGNCLSCGGRTYAQSYCDSCSEDPNFVCQDCGEDGFEKPYDNCFEHEMDEIRGHIDDLKNKIALKDARIKALNAIVAKKDGQIDELMDAVRLLKTCLDERVKP